MMKYTLTAIAAGLGLAFAAANAKDPVGAESNAEMVREVALANKTGKLAKLDFHLRHHVLSGSSQKGANVAQSGLNGIEPFVPAVGDFVTIDVVAAGDPKVLLAELSAMGLTNGAAYGRMVSGRFPVADLSQLADVQGVQFARQSLMVNSAGSVTSQGAAAMNSDVISALSGITGAGIRIGSLSDSFNTRFAPLTTAEDDVASNDLPSDIIVLDDTFLGGSDEGRGMMQLIHDVAPGSSQAFHTAFNGVAGFAEGIEELDLIAGSDIIVDDIIYLAEPMYQDGPIAQAVDAVNSRGVAYFSSAGNNGRDGWEADSGGFEDSGEVGIFGGARHDFDRSRRGVDGLQNMLLFPNTEVQLVVQWADPAFSVSGAPGAASDLDALLYLGDGTFTGLSSASFNVGGDPVEILGFTYGGAEPIEIALGLELFEGPAPRAMKWVAFISGGGLEVIDDATNSGTVYGHANAAGAIAVGASAWFNTPNFNANVSQAIVNGFSSAGPTTVLYDLAGNYKKQQRKRPQFVGPDGGNTTFFGGFIGFPVPGSTEPDEFPNFFGTSASAPHAAAVGALMLELDPSLTPVNMVNKMKDTADDMDDPSTPEFDVGYDFGTGAGFLRADLAVLEVVKKNGLYQICDQGTDTSVELDDVFAALGAGATLGKCN